MPGWSVQSRFGRADQTFMRPEVTELVSLGPLPNARDAAEDALRFEEYERLLPLIKTPVSQSEADSLVTLFGRDDCFGLAWTVLHIVESVPGGPDVSRWHADNDWVQLLRERSHH